MRLRGRIALRTLLVGLTLVGCSGGGHVGAAVPIAGYGAYDASGIASWYGEEAAGHRTASGDPFDPAALTAAHRSLPLGSFVEVTSLDTGRSIVVRVNDRGPGRRDRLIDLSRGAAHALGTDRLSVASVRVRALATGSRVGLLSAGIASSSPPASTPPSANGRYAVQVASFSDPDRAKALADRIGGRVVATGSLWRVRLGPIDGAQAANVARDAMAARGYGDARILPAD